MFTINRRDGRSQVDVVIDLVKDATSGTSFTHDDIIAVLNNGSAKSHSVKDAQSVVNRMRTRLSRLYQRELRAVPGLGYRVAYAHEHREVATSHKRKSQRQLSMGIRALKNVRWGEMDENHRTAHIGELMLMSALHERQNYMERRMEYMEHVLARFYSGEAQEGTAG